MKVVNGAVSTLDVMTLLMQTHCKQVPCHQTPTKRGFHPPKEEQNTALAHINRTRRLTRIAYNAEFFQHTQQFM